MPEGPDDLGPLPSGRHGLTPEQVAHHQRERLIAALAEAVVSQGYAKVTITDITRLAAVSRRTFYEHFESKEACFLAAFEIVIEHVHRLLEEAIAPIADWPHQILAGLRALLGFFDSEPDLAHLCLVDALTACPTRPRLRSSARSPR